MSERLLFKTGDIVRRNFGPQFTGVVVIGNEDSKRVLVRDRPDGQSSSYDGDELDLVWTVEQYAALIKPTNSLLRVAEAARELVKLMDDVGYPDGEESDRVFPQYEFEPLRKALAALHAPGERKEKA